MEECVFCAIITGHTPSWIIYQNETAICFLPRIPEVFGHTIIAPKRHIINLFDAPALVLQDVMMIAKELSVHYQRKIGATGINLVHASGVSAQQSVFHFHIHLFPRFDEDGLNAWPAFPPASYDNEDLWNRLKY